MALSRKKSFFPSGIRSEPQTAEPFAAEREITPGFGPFVREKMMSSAT